MNFRKITTLIIVACLLVISYAKAQDTAKFVPSGKLWGQVFGDYEVKSHSDSLQRGSAQYAGKNYPTTFNSFEFRRVYVGYDYNFDPRFTAQVLLSHEGNNFDAQGNRSFLLKLANIRWKNIFNNADLVVGQQSTNAYTMLSEQVWGYRSVEKTILDMRGITASSDFGIGLQGKFTSNANYGYNVLISNNTKYTPETNPYKKFAGDIWGKFMDKKLSVQLYGDYERSTNLPVEMDKITMKAFVGYQSDPITVGVEVFSVTAKKADINTNAEGVIDTANAMPFGFSIFAHAPVIKEKLGVFARFDSWDPDTKFSASDKKTNSAGHLKETFLTAGFDWTPGPKNVHFMPNIWMDNYSEKTTGVTGKVKSDYDLDIRLTFFWKF